MTAKRRERSPERTKSRLLDAAKRAFAAHGFHGATVQEMARAAGVNVSLISHHFGGKAGLYRACLEEFGTSRLVRLEKYLAPPASIEEFRVRLELLVQDLLAEHLDEPEVVTILLRDVDQRELWGPDLERLLFGFSVRFSEFFAEAQRREFVRADVDPMIAAAIVYLSFSGLVQVSAHVERMTGASLRDDEVRTALVKKTLGIVFEGIL
jgi:TetR/AcrR family transcriptional regulator